MFSAEEHPGIFYFMLGMIVMVMSGVGLSLLVDRRLKFSSGSKEIHREISVADDELNTLKARLKEQNLLLEKSNYRVEISTERRTQKIGPVAKL